MVHLGDQDHWSSTHDTIETDLAVGIHPSGMNHTTGASLGGDSAIEVTTNDRIPGLNNTREPISTSPLVHPASDTASVHSMPIVSVGEAHSSLTRRQSSSSLLAESPFVIPSSPSTPSRPQSALADASVPAQRHRDRHRSAIEFRSGRLSGFFTSLIHRRDPVPSPLSSRSTFRDERTPNASTPGSSPAPPRASSPPPRAVTPPPPPLPPPTLQELGLSLSVVTADLSPSHFSTPPWSGAFLEPHYLLLCHAHGLDVLPLVSPPVQQPYALVRRVSFKSVVVMEHRGVLIAIAGRRDGVRVYALEDIKKAVEWRIDFEMRRERERMRREAAKKLSPLESSVRFHRSSERKHKARLSTPPSFVGKKLTPRSSYDAMSDSVPTAPTSKEAILPVPACPEPSELPPPYVGPSDGHRQSNDSAAVSDHRSPFIVHGKDDDDWQEGSSDEEAIDVVAAGASGSAALDERTSATHSGSSSIPAVVATETRSLRRNRPANLDLSLSRTNTTIIGPPSPTPTLVTLRQALAQCPPPPRFPGTAADTPNVDIEDDEEEDGGISLVQALLESRLPDLPPMGTRRPQQPILITPTYTENVLMHISRPLDSVLTQSNSRSPGQQRRRWSVLDGVISNGPRVQSTAPAVVPSSATQSLITPPSTAPLERPAYRLLRSQSNRSRNSDSNASSTRTSALVSLTTATSISQPPTPIPVATSTTTPTRSSFFTRIFNHALHSRRSDEDVSATPPNGTDNESTKSGTTTSNPHPPKLEYVKLPGTKGAVLVKAVETAKKSFLAILCGENGEKVELFAGTYRTALGLSRTFILPDSPRSLELQLQGDDLVEIFLVFNQNVFGLEPATVRVREVRIGRAERRAARRRARELRHGDISSDPDNALNDEDPSVNVNIGVTVSVNAVTSGEDVPVSPFPSPAVEDTNGGETASASSLAHAQEMVAVASAQSGPYTTFQQLSFAPRFPLASIADDYIIPPTYPEFLQYRAEHEPEASGKGNTDLAHIQFSPPGLPIPVSMPPCRWFYRDPKGVIHGPWKASLMQTWYKDNLLPPDLPVRKEGETEFTLLRDLRLQCVDPTHPFWSSSPPPNSELMIPAQDPAKPLLKPISLLAEPKHFGPPALFFSSRGGHSTSIVDARGKSVLKGRFLWSEEVDDSKAKTMGRMGDVKHLEAFDVKDRSVLVAMRQGGLEAVDVGDALLRPADESRPLLPQFCPPASNTNRRGPFVWKIGTPVFSSPTSSTVLSSRTKGSHVKKQSTATTRSSAGKSDFSTDGDDCHEEFLFLGRKNDNIYMCEQNAGSFRILRLCPS